MLHVAFCLLSLADVDPESIGLAPDAFERHLPELLPRLIPMDELRRLFPSREGSPTCCPLQTLGMLALQFRYDLSERELDERCRRDLGFRYALGLGPGDEAPSERSRRRFRAKMVELKGDDFLLELSLRLAVADGFIDDVQTQAVDSTNTNCRGAVIDTYNLVSAGIGQVVRTVARCMGKRPDELARSWDLAPYMARGIKGAAGIDWDDQGQRNALLTQEIADADRVVARVADLDQQVKLPEQVREAVQLLAQVARQDVEQLDDGSFRIAKGTAKGRIISISDPEARHGRKSSSKVINGFKTHVLGTIKSQFVTGMAMTGADIHDARPTVLLLEQAERYGVGPDEAVGDNAYGTGANLRACKEIGVQMRTKQACSSSRGALPKRDFAIDLDAMEVTCPAGQTTTAYTTVLAETGSEVRVSNFHFDKGTCQQCELRMSCCSGTAKGGKRTIKLNPFERELQDNRAFAASERGRDLLRSRSSVERLISHLVRMGMRHARFFTMAKVQFQAYMVAAAYNLQRLITLKVASASRR
jgi:hypothetical protein